MKQHHTIEIFSANCPFCKHITDDIEIGKCKGCNQIIYNINEMLTRDYSIKNNKNNKV
jgi:hypothetical protein